MGSCSIIGFLRQGAGAGNTRLLLGHLVQQQAVLAAYASIGITANLRFVNWEIPLIGMARPSIAKTPFAQRLTAVREALGHKERKAFAGLLGMHPDTLGGYERGDTFPDQAFLARYKLDFSVNLDWLIAGEGEMFHDHVGDQHVQPTGGPTDLHQPGMITIRRYDDVRPSAGPGSAATSETPTTRVAFERHWLMELGVQTDAAVILPARGDSMEPTIMDGAPMLVDTSKTEVQNGYIYVISVENDLLVKRIRRRLDGRIDLISDNRAYEPETLDAVELQQLRVIGRVYAAVSKF